MKNICVAVKFGDIVIKISPKDTCECSWDDAIEKHRDKLTNPAFWQMVGNVYHEVNKVIKMLGHDPLNWVWTDLQASSSTAWNYFGAYGGIDANYKYDSYSVRATKVFKI